MRARVATSQFASPIVRPAGPTNEAIVSYTLASRSADLRAVRRCSRDAGARVRSTLLCG